MGTGMVWEGGIVEGREEEEERSGGRRRRKANENAFFVTANLKSYPWERGGGSGRVRREKWEKKQVKDQEKN